MIGKNILHYKILEKLGSPREIIMKIEIRNLIFVFTNFQYQGK